MADVRGFLLDGGHFILENWKC